jgi:hypothetical protein
VRHLHQQFSGVITIGQYECVGEQHKNRKYNSQQIKLMVAAVFHRIPYLASLPSGNCCH